MKYKAKALTTLQTIENRLSVLENVIEYNKPMTREDFAVQLGAVKKMVTQVIEMVDLEYDDTSRITAG
jgi:DNA-binding FrmR family transcriptional regulator